METRSQESNPESKEMQDISGITRFEIPNCFAVILAAGEGLPRQTYTPKSQLGRRPPQFLKKSGEDFLINKTHARIEEWFQSSSTFLTVSEEHSPYFEDILDGVPPENLIVLQHNDITTIQILNAAMRFLTVDPNTVLALFPMDFSTSDDETFFTQVESACLAVSQRPQLILMGIEPEDSESKFEWVEIDQKQSIDAGFKLWRILNFWHNPTAADDEIMGGNFPLNSTVVIGTASTLISKIRRAAPKIYSEFVANQSKTNPIN